MIAPFSIFYLMFHLSNESGIGIWINVFIALIYVFFLQWIFYPVQCLVNWTMIPRLTGSRYVLSNLLF